MAGSDPTIARFVPASFANAALDRWDLLCLTTLVLLWYCLLLLRNDSLPLQILDEGRLANSALEMVRSGHWLVPSYGNVPDHWSVKPPLLIWQMAALMWLGLPPLLAVRLPTMLAALATICTVWAVCRYALYDRVAAALAGLLLLTSSFYTNHHIARTGDYDVPLGLFVLLYALTFWWSIKQEGKVHIGWFAISAAALVLAVMTKGVAGSFGLAGLFVFSLMRGRLITLLSNFRVWLSAFLALFLCLGYYLSRDQYDPGYLQAVWQNELIRFSSTNEGHAAGPRFYIDILIADFKLGVILLPLATLTFLGSDGRRRSITTLCLCCAATILVLLTISQTKIYWYTTPILPFLAIAAALGVTDGLRWIRAREPNLPKLLHAGPLQVALGILLAVATAKSLYRNQVVMLRTAEQDFNGQLWYGALFDKLQARGNSSVMVLDGGVGRLGNYNPVLQFNADIARRNGLRVTLPALDTLPLGVVVHEGAIEGVRNYNPYADIGRGLQVEHPAVLPTGELVATCDPKLLPWLKHLDGFSLDGQVHSCIFGASHD
jgi:4-amino-4-deoxy-L-arabinose transferase-like glycosyltransferase